MTKLENEIFYKKVFKIAIPILLAQLMTSLLGFIDTYMVSGLGDYPLASVAIGANFGFFLIMVSFGFLSGLGIYLAQYWGSKDIGNIHKVFWITLLIAVMISSLFFVVVHFNPEFIIGLYNNSGNTVEEYWINYYGTQYLNIVTFSYFTIVLNFSIMMLMRSVERVIFPQMVSILTVLINTVLNYGLINGNLGMPSLGVEGAAIATVISGFTGTFILVGFMIVTKEEVYKLKLAKIKEITGSFVKMLTKKALPVAINETAWGLGMSLYLMAFGFISAEAIASVQISNQVMGLVWVTNAGISTACAIMIGNKLGENDIETAKKWGNKFVKLTAIAGILLGAILLLSSSAISNIFTQVSPSVRENLRVILIVFSFYVPIKFSNALQIIGTLRAGGDTVYVLFSEIVPLYVVGVPLAFILSIYTSLPIWVIIAIINIEEIIKLILVVKRYLSYKWARNLTLEQ